LRQGRYINSETEQRRRNVFPGYESGSVPSDVCNYHIATQIRRSVTFSDIILSDNPQHEFIRPVSRDDRQCSYRRSSNFPRVLVRRFS